MDDEWKQRAAAAHRTRLEDIAFGRLDGEAGIGSLADALSAVELGRRRLALVPLASAAAPGVLARALFARPRLEIVGEASSTAEVRLWAVALAGRRMAVERGTRSAALVGPVYGARTLKTLRMELQSRGGRRFHVIDRCGGAGETFLVEFDHPGGAGERLLVDSARFASVRALGTWQPVAVPVLAA